LQTSTDTSQHQMKQPKGTGLEERRKAAADAKQQLLDKFKAAPKPDDPQVQAKRAEREALAAARDVRHAERERLKQESAARRTAEAAERKVAEAQAREADLKDREERAAAGEAERKAERDRRYAARKARKR
jgi:hypothetical protein